MVRPAAPMRLNEVPAGTEEVTHRILYFYGLTLSIFDLPAHKAAIIVIPE